MFEQICLDRFHRHNWHLHWNYRHNIEDFQLMELNGNEMSFLHRLDSRFTYREKEEE